MTFVNNSAARFLTLLMATGLLVAMSQSATAQNKKPELQTEAAEIEEPKEAAPDRPDNFRRPREGLPDLGDWTPQAGKVREVDCSMTETVQFLPFDVYPLLPVKDDAELDGKSNLRINASITHTAGRILMTGYVRIWEGGGRRNLLSSNTQTEFKSSFAFDSIVYKKGCVIDKVTPSNGTIGDSANSNHHWGMVYGAGLIASAGCRQDTSGDDEGKVGCQKVTFRPISVSYREEDEERKCDAVEITPRTGFIYPLYNKGGNNPHTKDMDGNRVDVFVDSEINIADIPDGKGQELRISTNLKMAEIHDYAGRSMRVYGEGGQHNVFLTAFDAPGCRITSVTPATGTLRGKSTAGDHEPRTYGLSDANPGQAVGMIDYAICRTDTAGDDSGKIGCTEVVYKPLRIVMEPE